MQLRQRRAACAVLIAPLLFTACEEPDHLALAEEAYQARDCATAGFLTALLRGQEIGPALRLAAAAGARCVMAHDAVSGLGSYEQVEGMVQDYRPVELDLSADGWSRLSDGGLWAGPADACG